jgi:hypothetical protein
MRRAAACFLVLACVALTGTRISAQSGTGQLSVEIEYKGAKSVDAAHPLVIFLFEHPDPRKAPPVGVLLLTKKAGSVTFKNIHHSTVYVAALFDESGTFDVKNPGPPANGTPITAYKVAGARDFAPVTVSAPPKIKLIIDGSERWGS